MFSHLLWWFSWPSWCRYWKLLVFAFIRVCLQCHTGNRLTFLPHWVGTCEDTVLVFLWCTARRTHALVSDWIISIYSFSNICTRTWWGKSDASPKCRCGLAVTLPVDEVGGYLIDIELFEVITFIAAEHLWTKVLTCAKIGCLQSWIVLENRSTFHQHPESTLNPNSQLRMEELWMSREQDCVLTCGVARYDLFSVIKKAKTFRNDLFFTSFV